MLAQILLVHWAAMASPGPNVLEVIRTAMATSRREGLYVAAGIATGSLIWSAFAALGLALVFVHVEIAHDGLRVLGGLYLVYLGVSTFRAARRPPPATGAGARASTGVRAWRRGTLTNLSNPKAAVFFLSIFATLLPVDASTALRCAAVAVIVADALVWHALLAVAFSTPRAQASYLRRKGWIDRIAGSVMAGFGASFVAGAL